MRGEWLVSTQYPFVSKRSQLPVVGSPPTTPRTIATRRSWRPTILMRFFTSRLSDRPLAGMVETLWSLSTATRRGSGWAVLALGCRLALGAAISTLHSPGPTSECSWACSFLRFSVQSHIIRRAAVVIGYSCVVGACLL